MKSTGRANINSSEYWDSIYGDDHKRSVYAHDGTDESKASDAKPSQRFAKALLEVKRGDRVLDIGCGVGVFTKLVKETYPECEVWGTDISPKAIQDNEKEGIDITYRVSVVGNQDAPDDYFDFVFSGEVLEHLDDPKALFRDAYKVLRSGGKFLVSTPDTNHIQSEEHVWEFDYEDVEKLFLENGFKNVKFIYLPNMEHMYVIVGVGVKI